MGSKQVGLGLRHYLEIFQFRFTESPGEKRTRESAGQHRPKPRFETRKSSLNLEKATLLLTLNPKP